MLRDKVKFFLKMSDNARLDEAGLEKIYPNAVFIENKDTDTQCFTLRAENSVIIAFRGTQQPKDWLTDLNGVHVDYGMVPPYGNLDSEIRVHRGFIKAYKSVRDAIHEQVLKDLSHISTIYVCGHSLGGALATLCAVDMQYTNPDKTIFCFPSGNPKVGNKAFVQSYNRRVPDTTRTYTRKDLVPHLPPAWLERTFKQKSYHTAKGNPIGPRNIFAGFLHWIRNRLQKKRFAAGVTNHAIPFYEKYA